MEIRVFQHELSGKFPYFCTFKTNRVIMLSKPNNFLTFNMKKTPIKFGGFGNLYKHTHTHTHTHTHIQLINPSTRLFRAGLYGFSCNAAREADLFFAQGGPAFHKWGNVVESLRQREPMPKNAVEPLRQLEPMPKIVVVPLRQLEPMPKIVVEPIRQCETMPEIIVVPLRQCKPMPKIVVEPLRQRETMLGLGLQKPPDPLKRGTAQSDAELGSDRLVSGRPASGRFPPLEGVPEGRGSQKAPRQAHVRQAVSRLASRVPQSRSPAVSRPAVP